MQDMPEQGDLVTDDHIRWYEYEGSGKIILHTGDRDGEIAPDWKAMIRRHMDKQQFWPNVWFLSDHGNWHLIDMQPVMEK